MLLSSLLVVPVIPGHATGQVSVNGGTEVITPQSQTTVSVPINIAGSDALNGFDVQIVADPTVLSGASVSLTGSVLPSPSIVIECINGILVAGTTCAPQDGVGVVHLGAAHIGSLVAAPVSGLLFTITYNIVGTSAGTPIGFNTGCTGTSVSGDCVTVANGTPTAVPETDLAGSFANLNDFSMTAAFAKISSPASSPISDALSFTALGAFSDSLTVTNTGPCTLSSPSVDLTFPTGSDMLTCNSATNGDFPVSVTATGFAFGVTHSLSIDFLVAPAGFSSSLSQNTVSIRKGTSDSSTTVTVTGHSSFSGTVAVTATCPSGITGSAGSVALTADASGYSTGSTTLTINVASSVADGLTYSCAVTGGSTLNVFVPAVDFSIQATPTAESVPRGSTAAASITLTSLGSFAGAVTLTTSVAPVAIDAGTGVTNNVGPSLLPFTVTLTAGGSGNTAWFATTIKIGQTPNPANTATGNYTATITATSGSITHSVAISFLVQDFVLGPNFCPGNNPISTTPDGLWPIVFAGESCNTFTLATQTVNNGGGQSTLWVQVNSLGGLQTNGATATPGIAGGDPNGPGRGTRVPYLHGKFCLEQIFFANGTRIPASFIAANGPVVANSVFGGCRFLGEAFPDDVGFTSTNIDFFKVTADALPTTATGTYLVNVCGELGTLINCEMVTLIVISTPVVHQFVYLHHVSVAAGGVQTFKVGITNTDLTNAIYAQVTVTATGSLGDTPSVMSAIVKINPNANSNNLALSLTFTAANIGETYSFSSTILASAVDPGAVVLSPPDLVFGIPMTGAGTSTLQSVVATFSVGQ